VAHKVAPALAGGNAVVLKPASTTPLTALRLAELLVEAGLPDGVLQVVLGSGATIVDEDANLDLAVQRIVAGGFANSGQTCISVQRVVVHERVYDAFLAMLIPAVAALKVGDPQEKDTDVSALINPQEQARVQEWIQEALDAGAKLETGGPQPDGRLKPMVVTGVTRTMKVVCRELFGPVVTVMPARDLCDAIEIANDSDYGLQAGVFTNDLNKALYAARHLEVGGVMINEVPTFRVDHMPYGGKKMSGMGREGLKYAIQEMTELKMVTIREIEWCPVDLG
jgi:acyl-CoA reductase-like NAD-dependent aldehyde dehydrogenase